MLGLRDQDLGLRILESRLALRMWVKALKNPLPLTSTLRTYVMISAHIDSGAGRGGGVGALEGVISRGSGVIRIVCCGMLYTYSYIYL